MKKLFLLLILAAPLFCRAQITDTSTLIRVGQPAPTFTFYLNNKKTAELKDYRGKIVLINFFATWCGPCRAELPRVQSEIWEKYKNNPRFALLAFDRQEGWDKILPLKQSQGFTFPMLPDADRKIYGQYAKAYIPRNIVLDEKGNIIYESMGYEPQEFNKLLALLADKLK